MNWKLVPVALIRSNSDGAPGANAQKSPITVVVSLRSCIGLGRPRCCPYLCRSFVKAISDSSIVNKHSVLFGGLAAAALLTTSGANAATFNFVDLSNTQDTERGYQPYATSDDGITLTASEPPQAKSILRYWLA